MYKLRNYFVAVLFAATATLASFAAQAADTNVAGTWVVSVESQQGVRESTLTLTQKGSDLTGTIKGARGENPVTGSVKGSDVKFSYTLSFNDQNITIEYEGKVDGAAMSGTTKTPRGENKFTAKKQ